MDLEQDNNKDFVTYEIAKKLANMGFSELCYGLYDSETAVESLKKFRLGRVHYQTPGYYLAPLWQQVWNFCLQQDILVRKQFHSWEVVTKHKYQELIEYVSVHPESVALKALELMERQLNPSKLIDTDERIKN